MLSIVREQGGEGSAPVVVVVVVVVVGGGVGSVQTYLVIVQSCMVVIQQFLVLCHNAPMLMLKFKKFFPTKV